MPDSPTSTGSADRHSDSILQSAYHFSIPPAATPKEAAAIVTAINTHLQQLDQSARPPPESWQGRRWAFAGRIESLGGPPVRVPHNAPTDPWTAAGRTDRI